MQGLKKIRILIVCFDTELRAYEIPAFRSAIIEKAGRENILFHNHLNDKDYLYKYPLIQYKQINLNPTIVCIDYGVDEIHKYFENKTWDIQIGDRWLDMKIKKLNMNQFNMQVWEKMFDYSIINWIALNQENYKKYLQIESMAEKIIFLENTLKANIISFAKGIEWTVEKPIELTIKKINEPKIIKLKTKKIIGFDCIFSTNVFLPNYIGLGKAVSKGFGVIKQIRNHHSNTENIYNG